MNQEKKTSQTERSASEYLAPEFKVMDIHVHKVICQSGGTEDGNEGDTSKWF